MNHKTRSRLDILSLIILVGTILAAIGSNYYHYLYAKDYKYLISNDCDSSSVGCVTETYYIDADEYQKCQVEGCINACHNSNVLCSTAK